MPGRVQALYGCWYSAGFSPAFPSAGRFYPRCDPHTSANAICLIYKRIILHEKASDSYRGPKTAESRKDGGAGRKALAESHVRVARGALPSRALRRRPQSEFLKRSEDCLSDWALPKRTGTRGLTGALRRRPQCEFLKRCGDCLNDWTLPKSLGRAEGRPRAPAIWANLVASPTRPVPQPAKLLP